MLKWPDEIVEVRAANINQFEGGLFRIEGRGWALLYNERLKSAGRVRFTQAHELGHYMLHRAIQDVFQCSVSDMVHWGPGQRVLESQADDFASHLLMPMKQFRSSMAGQQVDFEVLSDVSLKFGVSLTAASLRWVQSTEESAILILARDGYIDWSVSSDKARANGAFFRSRGRVVPLPSASLAADDSVESCRSGRRIDLNTWFEHAERGAVAREMKLLCENYGYTLSLLHLSRGDKVWAPKEWT